MRVRSKRSASSAVLRGLRASALRCLVVAACIACTESSGPGSNLPARTFRMGFSAIPPRPTNESVLATIDAWSGRADAAIMHVSVPYAAMLDGNSATTYVNVVDLPLADYYRDKNLRVVVTLDVTDGLNRAAEAPDLVALNRSITEPEIQQLYRQYAVAIASIIKPDHLFLAAETNLIRFSAPDSVYDAMVTMVNAAVADINALPMPRPLLGVTVQVEVAWGRIIFGDVYQGVETDFTDFPFTQTLGLSSYPYLTFAEPEDVPLNYYFRVANGRTVPLLVVEGGWPSGSVGGVQSTPEKQVRYLRHQERMLDSAKVAALFQLTFTDLDVESFGVPPGSALPIFALNGFVGVDFTPKLSLATYDSIFARPRGQ